MLPARLGVCAVIGSAALGALVTAAAGSEPGLLLGVFVVGGTIAAAFAVRPRLVHLIIPVPALAYVVAATTAGLIHDRAVGTSSTALAVGATQWIASGFVAMAIATILAIAITVGRKYSSRRGPRGRGQRPPDPGQRPPGRGQRSSGRGQRPPDAGADGRRRPPPARSAPARRGPQRQPDYPSVAAVRNQRARYQEDQ